MSDDIRLSICLPSRGMNPQEFTVSLALLAGRIAAGMLGPIGLSIDPMRSSSVCTDRELLVKDAVDRDYTHLLFLDDDMWFDAEAVRLLFSRKLPIVGVNYLIKTMPPDTFVATGLDGVTRVPTLESSSGVEEVAYTGFGVCLFETRVFKETQQPWFMPEYVPGTGYYLLDDVPCMRKLRAHGFPAHIDHDASKLVSHIGLADWDWRHYRPSKNKIVGPPQGSAGVLS